MATWVLIGSALACFAGGIALRLLAARIGMRHWERFAESGEADRTGAIADTVERLAQVLLLGAWIFAGILLLRMVGCLPQ